MIEMKSLTNFHNPNIVKADGTHVVAPDDVFKTDWQHARELATGKLAEPLDPKALETEPVEAMRPHPGISAIDLAAVNERRAKAGKDAAAKDAGKDAR